MGKIENKIKELGHTLPPPGAPGGNYVPAVTLPDSGLIYTSGNVARRSDGTMIVGKLGEDITIEEGYAAAQTTMLNLLTVLKNESGELDRIQRVVKLLCMVNSTADFGDHPAVANGASDLLVEIFGDQGRHARSAVGMSSLPGGVCVEIEMIVKV